MEPHAAVLDEGGDLIYHSKREVKLGCPMRIDLHADDFGVTRSVNANILAAWRAGALAGMSVIANGDALYEAAKEVQSDADRALRLAVHLNLSEGYALLDRSHVNLLVDKNGRFLHGFMGTWRMWMVSNRASRQRLLRQVEVEWSKQIRTVIDVFSPRPVTALDGHIHIHMLPFLFPVAVALAKQFSLPQIRISREIWHFSLRRSLGIDFPVNVFKHVLLNLLSHSARRVAKEAGLVSPDAISGVLYSGRMTSQAALAAAKSARRAHVRWLETIFHPGRATREEGYRWLGQSNIFKFYLNPHRDVERDELIKMAPQQYNYE